MRALILTDEPFLVREPGMLRRLEVGLADEGVSVILGVPDAATDIPGAGLFSQVVSYPTQAPWFMERWRVRRMLDAIRESDAAAGTSSRQIDVVHVYGEGAWGLAVHTARQLACPLVVEVWSAALAARAAGLPHALHSAVPLALMAPDRAIEEALRREDAALSVRFAPWGVHVSTEPNAMPRQGDTAIGVMVIGGGSRPADFQAAFQGVVDVMKRRPRTMLFADAYPVRVSHTWAGVRLDEVLDRITLVPRMEGVRSLVLCGSIMICPEACGEHRSIILDAMGHSMVVVAQRDPMVSALKDGQTAILVPSPEPEAWAGALESVLADPVRAAKLGESARAYVAQEHRVSMHISAILDVYERLRTGETLPFPGQAPAHGSTQGR